MKKLITLGIIFAAFVAVQSPASAEKPEKTAGFVCPVISTENVLHSPHGEMIGEGHYTILGPDVTVPVHATNGDGAGTPPGPHSEPGYTDYTAVRAGN